MFDWKCVDTHTTNPEHRRPIIRVLALLAVGFQIPCACGQASQPPSPPTTQSIDAPAGASDISLDLVVHDKRNRPVVDLKPAEIAVFDNGSPVTLSDLRLVTSTEKNDGLITLVFDRPIPAEETANQSDPSLIKGTRDSAMKILKLFPAGDFSFSVFNVEGRLRLQQAFTTDRKALEQAVITATEPMKSTGAAVNEPEKQLIAVALTGADSSGKRASTTDRDLAKALYSSLNSSGRIGQDQHLRPSLAALLALAQSQQELTQRKAVIYFSSMQDRQIDSHAKEAIDSIIGTANQAGLSLYVVDMNSLDRTAALASEDMQAPLPDSMPGKGQEFAIKRADNYDMQHMAEETGGSFINGDREQKSIDQLIQDMTTYYVASYPSEEKEFEGKFRSVAVKPLRPGIKIRTQTGYFALAPHAEVAAYPQPFDLQLLKVFSETPLPAEVAFQASILDMGAKSDGNAQILAIEAPLTSLDVRADSATNLFSVHISMVADIKDNAGNIVERFRADVPRRGTVKSGVATVEPITLQRGFLAPPGKYTLEAAILDRNSGKSSAQRIAFEVPKVSEAPSLSSMVLVRRTEPLGTGDNSLDSLHNGKDKVIPNLSGQILSGEKVSVFFVAHADTHASEAATLKILVSRDGKPLGGAPMASRLSSGSESSSFLTGFSVDPPVNGLYEVRAILSQGGKTAQASTSFTLTGAHSPGEDPPAAEADSTSLASAAPAGSLVVTLPANPANRPPGNELKSILADATRNAMDYRDSLPNFICERVTNRSVDGDGSGKWKHKDKFTELLTYVDHQESRTMLEIEEDGRTTLGDIAAASGVQSAGEFGSVISGIFRPDSKTKFEWKETGALGDGTVQIFDYRVEQENSTLNLRVSATEVESVGFHGQVFIDSATRSVRRISQVVDDPPRKFPIHATFVSVDYDYISINNHDYLLPISAQIIVKKGGRAKNLNEIEFRNFRRFGSKIKILNDAPNEKP